MGKEEKGGSDHPGVGSMPVSKGGEEVPAVEVGMAGETIRADYTLLSLANWAPSRKAFLEALVEQLSEWTQCRCVGVRLLNERGEIPYEASRGFSEAFWASENWLSITRDSCACTRVVLGEPEPQDLAFMTPGGSFRCEDTASIPSVLSPKEIDRFRGVCIKSGFRSVAVVPVRYDGKIMGAIHLCDERQGMVSCSTIAFIESITPLLGKTVQRFNLQDELRSNLETQKVVSSLLQLSLEELSVDEMMDRALGLLLASPQFPFESAGSLFIAEEDKGILAMKAQRGLPSVIRDNCLQVPFGNCFCGRVAIDQTVQFLDRDGNVDGKAVCALDIPFDHCSVPVVSTGKTLGLINLHVPKGHHWDPREEDFLVTVARALAGIILRKRAEEKLTIYMERLERSNRDLQDFAYVASHDLQEPLRKIQAFGDRLYSGYKDALDEAGRDFLHRMQNAAERMQNLIQSLLGYSRITTMAEPLTKIELNGLVREVLADLDERIDQAGAKVEIEDLPVLEADPHQLRQLFQNLVCNALKFNESENPIVRIYADQAVDGHCRICVEDNGIGFDEKYLDRIFSPFQRLHGRSAYEGTGMGLAICRKIVERHRGSITARSIPGRGSTFIVVLPFEKLRK